MEDLSVLAPVLLVLGAAALGLWGRDPDGRWLRLLWAWGILLLMGRYLAWRVSETLPAPGEAAFVPAAVFFGLEALSMAAGAILLHVLSRTLGPARSREADAHPPESFPGGPPLVDVLVPTYNESAEILERTILGAVSMDYPRFRVWVLDDGRRPEVAALAERLGAGYLTRPDGRHAKAGNMNAALARLLALPEPPEAVAVFDADFVAAPGFLRRTVALLHDPSVAVVQTPQRFFNPDPVQMNLDGARRIPDEQRFFFDVILPSKDAHGTAFCCGTSSLARVSFLKAIGGFPTESVTEDLLTSIKAAEIGMRTVYLNEQLSAGLAPEGLGEYITQRARWCLGTMQIARSPWGPLSPSRRIPWRIRLHTLDTVLFWTVGSALRLGCLLVPILYWFLGLAVMRTDLSGLLWNFVPYWLAFALFLSHVSRGTNIPVLAEAMGLLTSFHALGAAAVGLFGRRDQKFKVTDKGATRDRAVVRWGLAGPFLGLAGLTLLGVGLAAVQGPPAGADAGVEAMNLFWSLYNVVVLSIAAIFCVERPRFRREERFAAAEEAWIRRLGGEFVPARLEDLSLGGCRLSPLAEGVPAPGERAGIWIEGVGEAGATCVAADAQGLRLAFLPDQTVKAALVRRIFGGGMVRPIETLRPGDFAAAALRRALG